MSSNRFPFSVISQSKNSFFNEDRKAGTPEDVRKEKFKQTNRSLSVDSFFNKAPEKSHYHQEDPFSHDWVNVMWSWSNGKF